MVTWWFVGLAFIGAICRALGAALQERDAVRAPGGTVARLGLLLHLARRPRWLAGIAVAGAGMALHLLALGGAPLAVIQPIGVSGVVFAVVFAALFNRRRVSGRELAASATVLVGLVSFVLVLVDEPVAPTLNPSAAVGVVAGLVVVGLTAFGLAPRTPPKVRVLILAGPAGMALGVAAGFVRLVGHDLASGPSALLGWLPVVALGSLLLCGLLLQNAFRTGRFAAAYAAFLLCDAATGVAVGALLLGEPLPSGLLGQVGAAAAAVCAIAGTVALAAVRHDAESTGPPTVARDHETPIPERGNDSGAYTPIPDDARE
ncbi:DMT family transporter [Spiractinospora alimapuensis]|uniref:DMT family transporter n=1 Tax=Spiractinospora alimapuensis TaxID=2820884 RepID=UPI001F1FAE28|nr:DMT family transporter [Spiractinospora alimapuensis]QVQ52743.1 DMT family transporter [Spiractinospora alimapuensis]